MSEHHHNETVEVGAPMNYAEHEKTYHAFLVGAKYATIILCALMAAMAAGFFSAAGFFGGFIVFLALTAAGIVLLR